MGRGRGGINTRNPAIANLADEARFMSRSELSQTYRSMQSAADRAEATINALGSNAAPSQRREARRLQQMARVLRRELGRR